MLQIIPILTIFTRSLSGIILTRVLRTQFSASQRCHPPHSNVDILRNTVHLSGVVQRLGLQDSAQLVALLENLNTALSKTTDRSWSKQKFKSTAVRPHVHVLHVTAYVYFTKMSS